MQDEAHADVIDVWESVTGHLLSDERQVAFAMRYEVRALGRLPLPLLFGSARRTLLANSDGHLLLEEWLATVQQARPVDLESMTAEGVQMQPFGDPSDDLQE